MSWECLVTDYSSSLSPSSQSLKEWVSWTDGCLSKLIVFAKGTIQESSYLYKKIYSVCLNS